jgi:mono/diheme cytochrome c family protein
MPMKKISFAFVLVAIISGFIASPSVQAEVSKAEKRQLLREGAELWPIYCAQCHNARPGSEFAPYQWDAIMMHMRGIPNMPAKDARAILEYLKAGRD